MNKLYIRSLLLWCAIGVSFCSSLLGMNNDKLINIDDVVSLEKAITSIPTENHQAIAEEILLNSPSRFLWTTLNAGTDLGRVWFSDDNKLLLASYDSGEVALWAWHTAQKPQYITKFKAHGDANLPVCSLSPDNKILACSSCKSSTVWLSFLDEAHHLDSKNSFQASKDFIAGIHFMGDGALMTGDIQGQVKLWRIVSNDIKAIREFELASSKSGYESYRMANNDKSLVARSDNKEIFIYDISEESVELKNTLQDKGKTRLFEIWNDTLCYRSNEESFVLFDLEENRAIKKIDTHSSYTRSCCLSKDKKIFIYDGNNDQSYMLNVNNKESQFIQCLPKSCHHKDPAVITLSIGPNNEVLSGRGDGRIRIWKQVALNDNYSLIPQAWFINHAIKETAKTGKQYTVKEHDEKIWNTLSITTRKKVLQTLLLESIAYHNLYKFSPSYDSIPNPFKIIVGSEEEKIWDEIPEELRRPLTTPVRKNVPKVIKSSFCVIN